MGTCRINLKRVLGLVVMVVATAWLSLAQTDTSGAGTACMQTIAFACTGGDTTAAVDRCCKALTDAIDNQRQCFCLLKPSLAAQGANPDDIAALFTACSINGDLNSLCPGGSSNTSSDGSTPVDNPSSTASSDSSTSTSTGGSIGGGLGGGKRNAGNKIATLSLSTLLVVSTSLMMIIPGI